MTPTEYISKQVPERQNLLTAIHEIIISEDKKVDFKVAEMMGKEMIQYCCSTVFKYAISSVNTHISLHLMPIYGSSTLHSKYEKLLNKAKFQKGCINFKNEEQMPLDIVRELIKDCSKVDMQKIFDEFKKKK